MHFRRIDPIFSVFICLAGSILPLLFFVRAMMDSGVPVVEVVARGQSGHNGGFSERVDETTWCNYTSSL